VFLVQWSNTIFLYAARSRDCWTASLQDTVTVQSIPWCYQSTSSEVFLSPTPSTDFSNTVLLKFTLANYNNLACFGCVWQMNIFLNRLNGERIGVSVLGIFVIDKNTILTVCFRVRLSLHVIWISYSNILQAVNKVTVKHLGYVYIKLSNALQKFMILCPFR